MNRYQVKKWHSHYFDLKLLSGRCEVCMQLGDTEYRKVSSECFTRVERIRHERLVENRGSRHGEKG